MDAYRWEDGGKRYEADEQGVFEVVGENLRQFGQSVAGGREILRLCAERDQRRNEADHWRKLAEERAAIIANERELRERDAKQANRLAGELGAARETIAILDASAKAAGGGTAPLWNEIHHLSGRLEKASEEIGRLKGELAVERERAESASGELSSCRQIINDAAQERLRLGEQTAILFNRAGQAEALVTKLRGRTEELERENYRLRDGVEKARRLIQPLAESDVVTTNILAALDHLKAAAEGAPAPAGGLAVEVEPRFSREDLRAAVDGACTCGGSGPLDIAACPACLVWHALVRPKEG